jgi:hypothetical protein
MAPCLQCGATLHPGDRFCTQCGATVPEQPRRTRIPVALSVAVVAVFLAAVAGAAWYALGGRIGAVAAAPAAPSPAPAVGEVDPPPPTQPGADPSSGAPDPAEALAAQAAADRPAADASVGSWLPQISSKADGLTVNGVVYDNARILAEFRDARQQYEAILVRSDDFSTFRNAGYWVVLVPQRFTTPQAANSWCATHGFAPADCFAKRLSHTDGPEGNTVQWRR